MISTFPAVYEHGILRPLEPLLLPEASRVRVQILQDEQDERETSYQRTLLNLIRFLTVVERDWSNPLVQQVFTQRIEGDLRALWQLANPLGRELCGMFVLASTQLQPEQITQEQVRTFLDGLRLLEKTSLEKRPLSDNELDACYDRFTLAGLPPSLTLDEKVIQSYVDEF